MFRPLGCGMNRGQKCEFVGVELAFRHGISHSGLFTTEAAAVRADRG